MELDRRISNKLLVGGIFAVLILGLVGSQQAMAGENGPPPPTDLEVNKCVTEIGTGTGIGSVNRINCAPEASARSVLLREEGQTGFFRIDVRQTDDGSIGSVLIQDKLPAGLKFLGFSTDGTDYDPNTGEWDVGSIADGTARRFLIIEFEVLPGTCDSILVNTASLDPASQDGTGDSNDSDSATVEVRGAGAGDEPCPSKSSGGGSHEPPTIGENRAGIQVVYSNGICVDLLKNPDQCWTVTEFDTGFKLLPLLSSSHTISNTIFCNEGVQECNYVGISFMTSTDLFGELVMMVEAKKTDGEWIISWYDPQDFIHDPDDYLVGDPRGAITFTAQIVDGAGIISQDGNFLLTSFTIDFKNKDTDVLVIRIQVGDEERGLGTFWFNEGVQIIDSDAYPSIETAYENPLEIDSLCLNEDPNYRYSCGFAKILERTIQNAEETLWQMLNGEYIFK